MRVSIARISVLGVSAAVACLGISIDAQAPRAGAAKSAKTIARTPDGHPDLQGIYDFSTATPLERPVALGDKAVFTDEEAAAFVKQQLGNRAASDDAPLPKGNVGGYNQFWYEFGTQVVPDKRTSLITDPPNGRLPALTPEAQKIADGHREQLRRLADGPEQRDVSERCLLGYNAGPPMVGVGYNQHVQIVQTPRVRIDSHGDGPYRANRAARRPSALRRALPPVVGRFPRPLGRRHAGGRDDQFPRPSRGTSSAAGTG